MGQYFNRDDVKFDLGITGTAFDDVIDNRWGPESDVEVDDRIFTTASKQRLIKSLPILPLDGDDITQTIKSASNHFVKQKYYQKTRNEPKAKEEENSAVRNINAYLARQNVDAEYYGRVIR